MTKKIVDNLIWKEKIETRVHLVKVLENKL